MGNANDLERFAELLDTLMVKLRDAEVQAHYTYHFSES